MLSYLGLIFLHTVYMKETYQQMNLVYLYMKVGMRSNHHAPYDLGHTRATMAITKSGETVKLSESQKDSLSSD